MVFNATFNILAGSFIGEGNEKNHRPATSH
jgi:hypothetical protein